MLDRNVGASAADKSGNYYQWGNNTPVALEGETAVNAQYSADWTYDKAVDWTKPENTPCPMGWGLPTHEQMTVLENIFDLIFYYEEFGEGSKEDYDAAKALLNKMQIPDSDKFTKKSNPNLAGTGYGYFWTAYVSDDHTMVGIFETSTYPNYGKKQTFDNAIPVRCVKAAPKAE